MKYETTGQITKAVTLKDIQAISDFKRKYTAQTQEEYEAQLKKMALADIQSHAIRVGVAAKNDRKQMEKILIQQYKKSKLSFEFATGAQCATKSSRSTDMTEDRKKAIEEIGKYFR